jgi:hypothetical protein
MKKGAGKNKGGAFERLICKKLSLWWTDGKRDDIFARTASSGGRATQRSKKNLTTFGQYGDIQAADPIGQPLIDLAVIECKDGYASNSIADLLDKEPRHNPLYEQFIKQARQSNCESDSEYWLLIARRRGRQIMVFMPCDLYDSWIYAGLESNHAPDFLPIIKMIFHLRKISKNKKPTKKIEIIGTTLDCFLACIRPKDIKHLLWG